MSNLIPTAHIGAKYSEEIAKKVLMPGDPLRAKFIADTYLENVTQFNLVRNMFGYTGTYKGEKVSVMGSGMGIPSIGIYSYELYNFYNVDKIIRVGSGGALSEDIKVRDVVIGMGACTNSNFASQYNLQGTFAPIGSFNLIRKAVEIAESKNINIKVGNVLSSDIFYNDDNSINDSWKKMGVMAVEMEAAGLYLNAARCNKEALCILTISDHIYTGESLSAEDRQISFTEMMEIALEI